MPPYIRFLDTLTGVHQQAFRLLMRGNRLALDIQQPRLTVEVALLRFLEINKGCIDITPMNTLLLFSVDTFIGKNEIIGSFTIRKICTVEYASAATRTTDMDWVKNAPRHHPRTSLKAHRHNNTLPLPPAILILGLHIAEAWHTYTQTGQAGSYQEALELDYFVKCEATMLNGGRQPKNLATRLLLCGDVTLRHGRSMWWQTTSTGSLGVSTQPRKRVCRKSCT